MLKKPMKKLNTKCELMTAQKIVNKIKTKKIKK